MINCYKSQISQKNYEYYALGLNQYRGMFKDKEYVEAFCILGINEFKKICELYSTPVTNHQKTSIKINTGKQQLT